MTKKGLSFEQKTEKLRTALEYQQFYIFKELESIAKKQGIIVQAVKDVVQDLVDNNFLTTERIGSQNIYWLRRKEVVKSTKDQLVELRQLQTDLTNDITDLENQKLSLCSTNIDCSSSASLSALREKLQELQDLRASSRNNSVEAIEEIKQEIEYARRALLRWYDNICTTRQWVQGKTGYSETQINDLFDINLSPDADLDY